MTKILIILKKRTLYLYKNGQIIRSFPVAIGKPATPTPLGNFSIINKIKNPYNKVLGSRWMQFTHRMHGIHGTNQPWSIGKAVSSGCVRMYNHDAEFVYDQVNIGTPIEIKENNTAYNQKNQSFIYYTVKNGDTLYRIAQKFNTTAKLISKANNSINSHLIFPGQKIKIPN